MEKGSFMLVLHAHLPYVRHPEHEFFLEENWLYEAAVESYLPLLAMLGRLEEEGVDYRLTLSLSPTLLEMLVDPLLSGRLERHMDRLIELTERELHRTKEDAALAPLARMYNRRLRGLKRFHGRGIGGDLVGAFRTLGESGKVELITTAATHAYLPNLAPHPDAVRAQLRVGIHTFIKHMGYAPRGLWLPECGYFPGLDGILAELDAGYFFLETHGLLHARPRPRHGVYRPVLSPSGPAAFARDAAPARRVWCAQSGYPGHPDYREFHRDIGHDLPIKNIRGYIHPDGIRMPTGIKYHRVTGKTGHKAPYVRERALARARHDALDFIDSLLRQAEAIRTVSGVRPLTVAPYDAELFGHWWFEGVEWLEQVLRGLAERRDIRAVTPTEYLSGASGLEEAALPLSSWGEGGYGQTWAGEGNAWAVAEILRASEGMGRLVKNSPSRETYPAALAQALRELLLAQSSDWTFLMHRGTSAEYAGSRLREHLENFRLLEGMLSGGRIGKEQLTRLEQKNRLFPDIGAGFYGRSLA